RGGRRLIPRLEKLDLPERAQAAVPFEQAGGFLLTGGLGGIAVDFARPLLAEKAAKILVGRPTPLPPRADWPCHLESQSPVSNQIRTLKALEALDGDVRYVAVDVCDLSGMSAAVASAELAWNSRLDGILHLAGIYREALLVDETA